ncbi:hypothetical protein PFISCL1PPCAC_24035, partial [Pristionchus fissidentatus]
IKVVYHMTITSLSLLRHRFFITAERAGVYECIVVVIPTYSSYLHFARCTFMISQLIKGTVLFNIIWNSISSTAQCFFSCPACSTKIRLSFVFTQSHNFSLPGKTIVIATDGSVSTPFTTFDILSTVDEANIECEKEKK